MIGKRQLQLGSAALLAFASTLAVPTAHAGMPVSYAPRIAVAHTVAVFWHGQAQLRAVRAEGRVVARNGVAAHERLRRAAYPLPQAPSDPVARRLGGAGAASVNVQLRTGSDLLRRLSHAPALGTRAAVTRAHHVRRHSIAVVRPHAVVGVAVFHDALAPPSSL